MVRGADDPEEPLVDDEAAEVIQEAAFDPDLIAHMVRCWDAERENAARLASKVTQIVSALALVFGLGLFKIDWTVSATDVSRVRFQTAVWVIKGLLCGALLLFGIGLFLGIKGLKRRENRKFASASLRFDDALLKCPPRSDRESRATAYYRLSKAIDVLASQNEEKQARVSLCETCFVAGLVLVLLATLTYIIFSIPPMRTVEVPHGSNRNANRNDTNSTVTSVGRPNRKDEGVGDSGPHPQPETQSRIPQDWEGRGLGLREKYPEKAMASP